MNKLIVITSLVLFASSAWSDDEPGDIHTKHDITFGQAYESQLLKNGNCDHFHSQPDSNTDLFEAE